MKQHLRGGGGILAQVAGKLQAALTALGVDGRTSRTSSG
jgi:hypothetical protein